MDGKLWLKNNKAVILNEEAIACYTCPCSRCPCLMEDMENWQIIYFDKHANGLNDGSSWENAINDIQRIMDYRYHKIMIQGHGESDPYTIPLNTRYNNYIINEFIVSCYYIVGVGDLYLAFNFSDFLCSKFVNLNMIATPYTPSGDYGFFCCDDSIFENVHVTGKKRAHNGGHRQTFLNCTATNCEFGWMFTYQSSFENCQSNSNGVYTYGFYVLTECFLTNCQANNNDGPGFHGINSTMINCTANGNKFGGFYCTSSVLTGCISSNSIQGGGFSGQFNIFDSCVATGNYTCGFPDLTSYAGNTYNSCSEYGNNIYYISHHYSQELIDEYCPHF